MADDDGDAGDPRSDGERSRSIWVDALVGAVVTVVTAFIPFSPVLGGGVAGYLHRGEDREALRVGALAGLLASVPLLAIVSLVFLVLFVGIVVSGEVAAPLFVVAVLLVIALFVVAYTVVLSAVGGVVGRALGEREAQPATDGTDEGS